MGVFSLIFTSLLWANDSCMNRCFLQSTGEENKVSLYCVCEKTSFSWALPKANLQRMLKARVHGLDGANFETIARNSCVKGLKFGKEYFSESELDKRRKLHQQDLCSCVRVLTHMKPQKFCKRYAIGGQECSYSFSKAIPGAVQRAPTLFDYQYCLAKSRNYNPPKDCAQTECREPRPICREEEDLVNIADSGSCCPIFICKKRSQ